MRLIIISLGIILGLFSLSVMAGSNHDHGDDHGHSHSHTPVDQVTAGKKSQEIMAALVKRNKVDKSWKSISASSIEKKVYNNNQEWVVVFINKEISDTAKQKLYIFLTLGGDYIAVNYTGQ